MQGNLHCLKNFFLSKLLLPTLKRSIRTLREQIKQILSILFLFHECTPKIDENYHPISRYVRFASCVDVFHSSDFPLL